MKKITLPFLLVLFMFASANAQDFTTPNTGVTWTLDDIAAASPTTVTVSGTDYSLLGNLTISENDTFIVDSDLVLAIAAGLRITVFGTFTVESDAVTFTAIDEAAPYDGFRFEENSVIDIENATIQFGGGLRVLTESFAIDNCTITNNVSGTTTSAVIQLSRGMPQITNNTISFNENPAIGSAANSQVSGYIFNNIIEGNNQANSNRPQINMGTTLADEDLEIVQNTIIGDRSLDMVGGIAIANFVGGSVNVIIEDNIIKDNRYGITIIGPSDNAYILSNVIEDNDSQGDPMLGGSGISLSTSTMGNPVVVTENEFRRNLWGITVIGEATINLGDDDENSGENIFSENGNGGDIYAIYNNTAHTILAKHNCWIEGQESTPEEVEGVIFHSVDDATLGEVIFDPFLCGITVGVEENSLSNFGFYPNPVKNEINFNNNSSIEKVEIYGVQGNLISSKEISDGQQTLSVNLPSGLYFVNFSKQNGNITKKMIVE